MKYQKYEAARPYLLPLSAKSTEALRAMARNYLEFLNKTDFTLQDLCYTASVRRSHHDYRLAITFRTKEELVKHLEAFIKEETRPNMSSGRKISSRSRKLVFVFSGHGSQWPGMGRSLLEKEPSRSVLGQCDRTIRQYMDWSLATLLRSDKIRPNSNNVDIVQPTIFAIQVALAALWRSWGIIPDAIVGHSMGEVAAAHVAGILTLKDAVRIICRRSQLLKRVSGKGRMALVELPIIEAQCIVKSYRREVSIAAQNSPISTVLSGDPTALQEIIDSLERKNIFCRLVNTDVAFHSPQMDSLRADLARHLQKVHPDAGSIPFYSTVTGKAAAGKTLDVAYWVRNLREPVLFSPVIQLLLQQGHDILLEISPHPIVSASLNQVAAKRNDECIIIPSLKRNENEMAVMLGSLGRLYTVGYTSDWSKFYPLKDRCIQLPPYPWQRERFWLNSGDIKIPLDEDTLATTDLKRHPLLQGHHSESAHHPGEHSWEINLNRKYLPYLDDHRVQATTILSTAVYIEMAIAAFKEVIKKEESALTPSLQEFELQKAVFLSEKKEICRLYLVLSPVEPGNYSLNLYSKEKSWISHVKGKIILLDKNPAPHDIMQEAPEEIKNRCPREISGTECYSMFRNKDVQYGPYFQGIERAWQGDNEALGRIRVPDIVKSTLKAYQFHPAILDACAQVLLIALFTPKTDKFSNASNDDRDIYLPTHIERVRVYNSRIPSWSHARIQLQTEQDTTTKKGDIRLLDETGCLVAEIEGLRIENIGRIHSQSFAHHKAQNLSVDDTNEWLYELQWQHEPNLEKKPAQRSSGAWLILADDKNVGEALATLLESHGEKHALIFPGKSYECLEKGNRYRLDPTQPGDFLRFFKDVVEAPNFRCRGIIHLWGLDSPSLQALTANSLEAMQRLTCGSVLNLIHQQNRIEKLPPRLWLITQGAQSVSSEKDSDSSAIAQAPLWGLGRAIAQEHPVLWGGLIDLDPKETAHNSAAQILDTIWNPNGEDQIAFRQGKRHVARLVRKSTTIKQASPIRLRNDSSYLITGGLGDLGLQVARWMAERGARQLILVGRTKLPERAAWNQLDAKSRLAQRIAIIQELEAKGINVCLGAVDVADESQLTSFLKSLTHQGVLPIRGVVHAAGLARPKPLSQLHIASFNEVLRPKLMGSWLLHQFLVDTPLDFFVLFSSITSLFLGHGLSSYAAANAFLDALAHYRLAHGLPALSINWGAWEVGMSANYLEGFALRGTGSIPLKQGLKIFEYLLQQKMAQIAVIPVNWQQWQDAHPTSSELPLFRKLYIENGSLAADRKQRQETMNRDVLLAAEPEKRAPLLAAYISTQVAKILGLPPSKLDKLASLVDLGLDSLSGVELRNRIEMELGAPIPMAKLLSGQNITQLAESLLEQMAGTTSATAITTKKRNSRKQHSLPSLPAEQILETVDQLSDEEVDTLLKQILPKKGSDKNK